MQWMWALHTQTHIHSQANSEAETTLNAIGDGCVHSQGSVNRDTIDELHDLLGALETAKTAVQAQLDAQVATNIGRRCVCVHLFVCCLHPHLHAIASVCKPIFKTERYMLSIATRDYQLPSPPSTPALPRTKPLIPRWVTKYLLLITFLGQVNHIPHTRVCIVYT